MPTPSLSGQSYPGFGCADPIQALLGDMTFPGKLMFFLLVLFPIYFFFVRWKKTHVYCYFVCVFLKRRGLAGVRYYRGGFGGNENLKHSVEYLLVSPKIEHPREKINSQIYIRR